MAECAEFSRPMMRARARLHPDEARTEPLEERQHLRSTQLTAQNDPPLRIDAVQLENALGQVEADGDRTIHGWLPFCGRFTAPTLAHRDAASGAIHTISGASMARSVPSPRSSVRTARLHHARRADTSPAG